MKNYDSLADALDDLRKRGYQADFEPQSDCLYCNNLDLRLYEEDFNIDEVCRFEGDPNPDESVVIYALTSPTGVKGTIAEGFRINSENLGK